MVDAGFDEELELNIDWDHLLDELPDALNFDFCDVPVAGGPSPDAAGSLCIGEIEQYLMEDDESNLSKGIDLDVLADGFFSDVMLGSSPGPGSVLDRSKDSPASPELAAEVETNGGEKDKGKPHESVAKEKTKESNPDEGDVIDDDDDNDPVAKKRKRQMRNRDAAIKSRERKKMYVKDLEMKSKYYEAECKRLGYMLQCCLAENQALRLSMFSNKASDASMTKQESAVLFLESLLLGSLLWFLAIMCLLTMSGHLLSTLGNERRGEWENLTVPKRAENKVCRGVLGSFMLGRRCRASRSRMRLMFFAAQVEI